MFFEITGGNITSILNYAGGLVGDLMPLLVVVLGVFVGLMVIRAILHLR